MAFAVGTPEAGKQGRGPLTKWSPTRLASLFLFWEMLQAKVTRVAGRERRDGKRKVEKVQGGDSVMPHAREVAASSVYNL